MLNTCTSIDMRPRDKQNYVTRTGVKRVSNSQCIGSGLYTVSIVLAFQSDNL